MFHEFGKFLDSNYDAINDEKEDKSKILFFAKNFLNKINLKSQQKIPYGRYIAYESDNLNIQVDVFSINYEGNVHDHDTWGIIGVINGALLIKDWEKNCEDKNLINLTSVSLLSSGAVSYFPKKSDVHSTQTFDGDQVVSFHVYGKGFNLDVGRKYSFNESKWLEYKRGELKSFDTIIKFFN